MAKHVRDLFVCMILLCKSATFATSSFGQSDASTELHLDASKISSELSICDQCYGVNLGRYVSIDDEAALLLAGFNSPINLNGLVSLSPSASRAIGDRKGDTLLDGLRSVSVEAAKNLVGARPSSGRLDGRLISTLSLNGLETISPDLASILSQYEGNLELNSVERLSEAAASQLAKHRAASGRLPAILSLQGLTELPESPGHVALAKRLSLTPSTLDFSRLKTLEPGIAKALGESLAGQLDLGGLSQLDEQSAFHIAKYQGMLRLGGLRFLDLKVANGLSQRPRSSVLVLSGLEALDAEVLTSLVKSIDDTTTDHLAEAHCRVIEMPAIRKLDAASARALAHHRGRLKLNALCEIEDEGITELAKVRGWLDLDGLPSLTINAAQALSGHVGELHLNGLQSISNDSAEWLSMHRGTLYLNGLSELTTSAAKAFKEHHADGLSLVGLRHLSEEAAIELVKYRGRLELPLKNLSPSVQRLLSDRHEFSYLSAQGN